MFINLKGPLAREFTRDSVLSDLTVFFFCFVKSCDCFLHQFISLSHVWCKL